MGTEAAALLGGAPALVVTSHGYMTPPAKAHGMRDEHLGAALDVDLRGTLGLLWVETTRCSTVVSGWRRS